MIKAPPTEADIDQLIVIPADRTEREKREIYAAEWVTPINEMIFLGCVLSLVTKAD